MRKDFVYSDVVSPIKESEMKKWGSTPKSSTTRLFQQFVASSDQMVEVHLDKLPAPKAKGTSKLPSTKQDSFASSFYAWKRKNKDYLKSLGIDVYLLRRGERVALKKKKVK